MDLLTQLYDALQELCLAGGSVLGKRVFFGELWRFLRLWRLARHVDKRLQLPLSLLCSVICFSPPMLFTLEIISQRLVLRLQLLQPCLVCSQ